MPKTASYLQSMMDEKYKAWHITFWSHTWRMVSATHKRWLFGVIVVHFVLSLLYIQYQGFNPDEHAYFGYGVRWAKGNPVRIEVTDDSKSPLVFPSLLPIVIKPFYQQSNDPNGSFFLKLGRIFMYFYQLGGAFMLFCWLFRISPKTKFWLPPLILYLFDPTIFSYGMMVGTDIASAFILLMCCYTAWRYMHTRSARYWYWLCLACGFAFIVKASMVFILPVLMIAMIVHAYWHRWYRLPGYFKLTAIRWTQLIVAIVLCINLAYYFKGSFRPVSGMPEQSASFRHLKEQLSFASGVPVPFPYDYMTGFDMLMNNAAKGGGLAKEHSFIGIFILDKYFTRGPVWYYYVVSFLFKTPLLIFVFLITAVVLFIRNKQRWKMLERYLMLWWPPLFFFVLMSVNNPFQIGIRHAIILMPFMYMVAAYGIAWWMEKQVKLLTGLCILHSISVINYWPNMIAYTNELVFPKRKVYKYFYDSSISYRTERTFLQRFLLKHPDYKMPPVQPAAGKFVIDIERYALPWPLVDSNYNLHWLRDNFEPKDVYLHNILLFEITEQDLVMKGLK